MSAPLATQAVAVAPGRRLASDRLVLFAVGLAAFITTLDNTVVTIALPAIQRSLHLSLSGLEWVSTSYILAFSCELLLGGRAADVFGRRRCLLIGLSVFGAASVAAALAGSGPMLVVARVVQGSGAALVLPASLAVLSHDVSERYQPHGAGIWTAAVAVALSLGPLLGGAIVQVTSWGWIFMLNVPVCAVAIVTLVRHLAPSAPEPGTSSRIARLDLGGLVCSALALLTLTWLLVEGHNYRLGSPLVVAALLVTAVFAAAFVVCERRSDHPLVDVGLFRNRVLAGATVAQVLWGLGLNGVFFFTSLFLQDVLGLSPAGAGLAFIPLAIALVLVVAVVPRIVARFGAGITAGAGLAAIALGLVLVSRVPAHASVVALLPGLVLVGGGAGLTPPLTTSVLDVFPSERAGLAAGIVSTAREVSGVFGIAVIGAILVAREHAELHLGASASSAFLAGYRTGLQVGAALVLLGAVVTVATLPGRPSRDS